MISLSTFVTLMPIGFILFINIVIFVTPVCAFMTFVIYRLLGIVSIKCPGPADNRLYCSVKCNRVNFH